MPIIESVEAVMDIQMPDLLHYERSANCNVLLSTRWTILWVCETLQGL